MTEKTFMSAPVSPVPNKNAPCAANAAAPAPVPGQANANNSPGAKGSANSSSSATPHNAANNAAPTGDYSVNFIPNILDNYDTYTYHWKLFITPLKNAYDGSVLAASSQTIIAESGVTDLTIDKVELHGIAAPSVEAGTGTQTLVKFEVIEPSGAGLLDKMFYQAVSLGIGNWLVMPCFLQLEFRARDPDTAQSVENGSPGGLGMLRWVWPIKLTNAKANVTTVGTRYEFDAVLYDELAQSNAYFAVQHNIVLQKLSKFKDAMQDLEDKLNADQYEKLIDNYSIPDSYRIVVDPVLAKIDLALPDKNRHTSRGSDFIDFEKKTATYNTGTSVDKIVDSLLSSTEYFQKKLQSAPTSNSTPDTANKATPMRPLWRIITETKPIAFDMLRQDNAVEITIYIVEYNLGLVETDPSQTGQTAATRIAADKRLADYANKKILNKKYNYIFTGLNDQVIQFDLNMNFSFAASLSRFGGIYYDTASSDKGVTQQEVAKQEKAASEEVRKILQFINNAPNDPKTAEKIAEAKKSIAASQIDEKTKKRYTKLLDNSRPAERTAFSRDIQKAEGIDADGEFNRSRSNAMSLAPKLSGNLSFISDVDIYSPAAKQAHATAVSSRRGKLRPIPYREGVQEQNTAYGIDPASNAGRARVSSVFSTALYSTLDASLQAIKITIKGDPYWLFPRTLSPTAKGLPYKSLMPDNEAIELIKQSQIQDPTSVNLFGTDNFIVIRFRTPRIYNETEDNGDRTDPYTEVEAFSGVYKVITIISKFENGKFVQELSCILDPLIDLANYPDLLKSIEVAVQRPDPTIRSETGIPLPAQKTSRILGKVDIPNGQVVTARSQIDGKVLDLKKQVIGLPATALSNVPSLSNSPLARFLPPKIG